MRRCNCTRRNDSARRGSPTPCPFGRISASEAAVCPIGVPMSQRICILTSAQAAQLERQGHVPPCGRHHHCSKSKAVELYREGQARIVTPAASCKHAKTAIALIVKKDYRPAPILQGHLERVEEA